MNVMRRRNTCKMIWQTRSFCIFKLRSDLSERLQAQHLKLGISFLQAQFVDVLVGHVHLLVGKMFLHATDQFIKLSEDNDYRHCNGSTS